MDHTYVATVALTLFVFVLRKLPGLKQVWQWIPEGYRWLVPTLLGVLPPVIAALSQHQSPRDVLNVALVGLFGISLPAMGAHAAIKDSPLPVDGGPGGAS